MKLIALYGGSFNPSTEAHRDLGRMFLMQLKVDEVWYLVSPQNPFKPKEGMVSFEHRVAMARLNVDGHPGLVVQDIEAKYAQHSPTGVMETADTLKYLVRDFPDHRFVWTMGADNFVDFHKWGDAQYMVDNFPIILVPRVGYNDAALNSPSAALYSQIEKATDARFTNGWHMLEGEGSDIAATNCRPQLAMGQVPSCMRPEVAHYALNNRVYSPTLTIDKS